MIEQTITKNEIILSLAATKKLKYDNLLQTKNFYLPEFTCLATSESYLDAIYSDKVLRISNSHIKKPNSKKKCVSSDLINAINAEITKQKLPPLGFDQTNPANKEWLLNVLYTLNPEHELFVEDEKEDTLSFG